MHQNYEHLPQDEEGFKEWGTFSIPYTEPQWTDDVVYPFIEPSEFEYSEEKKDQFLFIGRVISTKGLELASNITQAAGSKLIVRGQGDLREVLGTKLPSHVEFRGHANVEERKKELSEAKGLFYLTHYVEHTGLATIEANLSGTPVISTDTGGHSDLVLSDKTGFRVRGFAEGVWAANNIEKINPKHCRKWGMNFTPKRQMPRYVQYIERIRAARYANNDLYYTQEVEDLSHRELIYPDDPAYDINLNKKDAGQIGSTGSIGTTGKIDQKSPHAPPAIDASQQEVKTKEQEMDERLEKKLEEERVLRGIKNRFRN